MYDFQSVVERRGTTSIKWHMIEDDMGVGSEDVIAMSVADMEFKPAPEIVEALVEAAQHDIFGYDYATDGYFRALTAWMSRRHNWDIDPAWVSLSDGVMPAVNTALRAVTHPGDKVILQGPVYYPFTAAAEHNGLTILDNRLVLGDDGRYVMDFDDLEAKASDPRCTALMLCNPHNPVGRVWSADELRRLGDICIAHGVTILADEIHADFAYPGHDVTMFGTLGERYAGHCYEFTAPTKTFNIAGVVSSYAIVPDEALRRRFFGWLEAGEFHEAPLLSAVATRAAFTPEGDAWRRQMLRYVEANVDFTDDFLRRYVPRIRAIRPEASFLVWLDCRKLGLAHDALVDLFVARAGLALNDGEMFGPGGEGHMRLNVGLPRIRLAEALERLRAAVDAR